MAVCGHQFHGDDESDWILSTSASCWDGSTTAGRILQELFKKNYRSMPNKTRRRRLKSVAAPSKKISIPKRNSETKINFPSPKDNENLIVKKITGFCNYENFDETQHLNGCPMKWLYNKRMLEKNKIYKMERLCNTNPGSKEKEKSTEKCKNIRDKTPTEVKIHKINLIEKYTSNSDEIHPPYVTFSSEKSERDLKDLENHRKKLAAKLNWKLHDESQNDSFETSSEISSKHNYFPPRPLLGLKPLLSVLLSPHHGDHCCSLVSLQGGLSKKKKEEASLSIQSLDFPFSPQQSKSLPKITNTLRWGSKSCILSKKLQIPNQITIKLDQQQKKSTQNPENQFKIVYHNPPAKKSNEKAKQTKTLSSLFYELRDKTNCRNQNEEYFEEMIRDLTMEESQFKIRRFFNIGSANSDLVDGFKMNLEKRKKSTEVYSADESELNLICEKVRFFEKKSSRSKEEDLLVSSH